MPRLRVALLAVVVVTGMPSHAAPPASPTPILVELFTSEGCSSCPPADRLLQRMIAEQPWPDVQVVGLAHHVDYWDRLGWRDRFSSAVLTARQQRYGEALHLESVYTPQMVADGRFQFVGSDTKAGRRALESALAQPHGSVMVSAQAADPNVTVAVSVDSLPFPRRDRADILVAVAEDGLQTNVRAGENAGRTLIHAAVVRRLVTIGEATGAQPAAHGTIRLDREWQRDRLRIVAFVQERSSRHILATGQTTLESDHR